MESEEGNEEYRAVQELCESGLNVKVWITCLREIKNNIIGHDRRKRRLIRLGVVIRLAEILAYEEQSDRLGKKRKICLSGDDCTSDSSGQGSNGYQRSSRCGVGKKLSEIEEARLQATLILRSLANGGLEFVTPIVKSGVINVLLARLPPSRNHALVITATLRTLIAIVKVYQVNDGVIGIALPDVNIMNELYSEHLSKVLSELLAQKIVSRSQEEHVKLTCQLIYKGCSKRRHRINLVKAGALDILASRMVANLLASKHYSVRDNFNDYKLEGKFSASHLSYAQIPRLLDPISVKYHRHILKAISRIVESSVYCVARLLYSPWVLRVFPIYGRPQNETKAKEELIGTISINMYRPSLLSELGECTLPKIPTITPTKGTSASIPISQDFEGFNGTELSSQAFPALGDFVRSFNENKSGVCLTETFQSRGNGDHFEQQEDGVMDGQKHCETVTKRDTATTSTMGSSQRDTESKQKEEEIEARELIKSIEKHGGNGEILLGMRSELIVWLIYKSRNTNFRDRIAYLELFTSIYRGIESESEGKVEVIEGWKRTDLYCRLRCRIVSLLVIPLLIKLFDEVTDAEATTSNITSDHKGESKATDLAHMDEDEGGRKYIQMIREIGPSLFHKLIENNSTLQNSAADSGALSKLFDMLKIALKSPTDGKIFTTNQRHGSISPECGERVQVQHCEETRRADKQNVENERKCSPSPDAKVNNGNDNNLKTVTLDGETAKQDAMTLGMVGLDRRMVQEHRFRAGILLALSSFVQTHDSYKKYLVDRGIISLIIPLLQRRYTHATTGACVEAGDDDHNDNDDTMKDNGTVNPDYVIVAACELVRSLSRSISLLRTNLFDLNLVIPIFNLIERTPTSHYVSDVSSSVSSPSSPPLHVTLAATKASCNLLLHFSSIRQHILNTNIIDNLCENAHSTHAQLRCASLWALKHLVYSVPLHVKSRCLHRLDPDWLLSLISPSNTTPANLYTSNSGLFSLECFSDSTEPVSSSSASPATSPSTSQVYSSSSSETETQIHHHHHHVHRTRINRGRTVAKSYFRGHPSGAIREHLRSMRRIEFNAQSKHLLHHHQIQEQVLDIVRNFIGDPCHRMVDMIDTLFNFIHGHENLYNLLALKLAPPTTPLPNEGIVNSEQHINLLISSLFVLIHIANGSPQHRHQIIFTPVNVDPTGDTIKRENAGKGVVERSSSKSALNGILTLVTPHFSHKDRRVRVACCWLAQNLLWEDDSKDSSSARLRAVQLRLIGWHHRIRSLMLDSDLDCRERARAVHNTFGRLTSPSPHGSTTDGMEIDEEAERSG